MAIHMAIRMDIHMAAMTMLIMTIVTRIKSMMKLKNQKRDHSLKLRTNRDERKQSTGVSQSPVPTWASAGLITGDWGRAREASRTWVPFGGKSTSWYTRNCASKLNGSVLKQNIRFFSTHQNSYKGQAVSICNLRIIHNIHDWFKPGSDLEERGGRPFSGNRPPQDPKDHPCYYCTPILADRAVIILEINQFWKESCLIMRAVIYCSEQWKWRGNLSSGVF